MLKSNLGAFARFRTRKPVPSSLRDVFDASPIKTATTSDERYEQWKEEFGRPVQTNSEVQQLNPRSSVFQPSVSPKTTMPDLSKLSLSDKGSSASSGDGFRMSEVDAAENSEQPRSQYLLPITSRQSTSMQGSPSPWRDLTCPPFTPYTPHSAASFGTPQTPYTPQVLYWRATGSNDDGLKGIRSDVTALPDIGVQMESAGELGRYLMVTNIPKTVSAEAIKNMIGHMANFKVIVADHLETKGMIIVAFYDSREAAKLFDKLRNNTVGFAEGTSPMQLHCYQVKREVVEQTTGRNREYDPMWEGSESVIVVEIGGEYNLTIQTMKDCLCLAGDLQRLQPVGLQGKRFVAEFFDTRDAITAVETLDGRVVGGASLSAKLLAHAVDSSAKPDGPALHYSTGASFTLGSAAYNPGSFLHAGAMGNAASTSSKDRHPIGDDPFLVDPSQATPEPFATIPTGATSDTTYRYKTPPGETSFQGMRHSDGPRESGGYAYHETPPHLTAMGRRMTEPGALQSIVNRCDISARSRQGHGLGSSYSPHDKQAIPEQNRVFPERIVSGLDSRTTLMIKDVPNKLSRQEMVDILNAVVPGGFDFVYLRFDFDNRCNVGYAFVNFSSVQSLYDFIRARVGKKWNIFSSEKVLQVCYATIQGKASLINKFRNSAVMGVLEPWRPQIFYSSGSLQGMPEHFPDSDNLAQRQKSGTARLSSLSGSYAPSPRFGNDEPYNYANSVFDASYGC